MNKQHKKRQSQKSSAGHDGMTLQECGLALGLSRERVRQIEKEALGKLRHWCLANGIDVSDLRG